ncbi:MAG: ABC transporter permease [Chloroflexota bacterium]
MVETSQPLHLGSASSLRSLPYALRVVLIRWREGLGMVVGVGLAIGIGMTMLAVSQASIDLFTGDYRDSGVDVYLAASGGKIVRFLPSDSPGSIKHAREKLSQVRGLPGVHAALGVLMWPLEREVAARSARGGPAEQVMTVGIDGDPTLISNSLVLTEGRWFRRADEIVVGQKVAREKHLRLGSRLRLAGRDFTIVGIGRLRGVSYTGDSFAYIDLAALRQRAQLGDVINLILVDSNSETASNRRFEELGSLTALDRAGLIREVNRANDAAIVLRWIIVGLTLAIAGLFVASMLSSSVAARRVEFATLRAIGIPARTVVQVVAGEAVLVCVLAGLVGVVFSGALGELINRQLAPSIGVERLYIANASLFLTVIGMIIVLGVLAGVQPAHQAANVDPVEVLREA